MDTLFNPLCTLDELKLTLKFALSDDEHDEELIKAINNASRWVEKHTGKQYRLFDYSVTPLTVDQFDEWVFEETVFLPQRKIVSLARVTLAGEDLVDGTDYTAKFDSGRVIILGGSWRLARPERLLQLYGLLGFRQPLIYPVTEAGDTGAALTNWSLRDIGAAVIYWGLTDLGASMAQVELWTDAAHSNRIAVGTVQAPGTVEFSEDNASGAFGTVQVAGGFVTDIDVGNTLTPAAPLIDTAEVPEDLPPNINQATRIVAAVFSGHHTKEISGLDGLKQTVKTTEIPRDVYTMLGRASPILT